jgi:head-tail adaptor
MTAGELRERVTIQTIAESSDGHDGLTDATPTDVKKRIAAKIVPLAGRDLERAKQIDPRASHEVTVRWWRTYGTDLAGGRAQLVWHDGRVGDRTLEVVERPREVEHRIALAMICREAA